METQSPSEWQRPAGREPAGTPGKVWAGLRTVSLLTLFSRVLGLIRDVGMAALFGNGVVMDAFVIAFRLPNLARRLFGEGALTAAFLPALVQEMHGQGRQSAWRLASAVLVLLTVALSSLVLLGELGLGVASLWVHTGDARLLVGLTALLLPYLVLICLAAQIGAIFHALEHFTWPALLPVLLNVVWIAAIWGLAPRLGSPTGQVYAITGCILAAGLLQLAAPLPKLYRLGFRWQRDWRQAKARVGGIVRSMLPVVVGLSITQVNTLADSLIAWGLAQPETGPKAVLWEGGPAYPVEAGSVSALYFGQRMYQFPLGVFGVALGTVLFPRLSQHAGRERFDLLRNDLTLGLKLVAGIGIPAGVGLILLARPLAVLLFQRGAFDGTDAEQTAGMIAAYSIAVWAYSGLLLVHRGYYACGDRITPMRVGLAAVALNLVLNALLIWPLGGAGLALATAVSAVVQMLGATWLLKGRTGSLNWPALWRTVVRVALATLVMSAVCLWTRQSFAVVDGTMGERILAVMIPLAASLVTYFAAARLLGLNELGLLVKRGSGSTETRDD